MKKADAIRFFERPEDGGESEAIKRLADALGITREAIYQWPEVVPPLRAHQLERMTRGALRVD